MQALAIPKRYVPIEVAFPTPGVAAVNSLVTSDPVGLIGRSGERFSLSVSGGGVPSLSINGGAWANRGTAVAGDSVRLRVTSGMGVGSVTTAWLHSRDRRLPFRVVATALFSPDSIAGMTLWMDASVLGLANNDPITTWTPRGGDGAQTAAVTVGTGAPVFKTGVLNGLGVSQFAAGAGRVRGTLTDTSTVYTVYGLARLLGSGHDRVFSGVYTPRNWLLGWHSAQGVVCMYGGAFISSAVANDTNWRLLMYTQNGSNGELFVDGVSAGTSGSQGEYLGDKFAFSGYDATGTNETVDCQIAEFGVHNTVLGTTDRQKVEGYAMWKWGRQASLPGGHPYAAAAP